MAESAGALSSSTSTSAAVGVMQHHDTTAQFNWVQEELKVLAYWKEIDAFRESLRQSEGRPAFSFYDGPPFATGLPHYVILPVDGTFDVLS